MAKQAKLITTIILLFFIAIMIPIAIYASNGIGARITNLVKFNVKDIEGKFFCAVKGNAKPEIYDLGYDQGNIQPQLLFSGEIEGDRYKILNSSGIEVTTAQISFPTNGVLFDEDHKNVEFYLVFLNTAIEDPDTPNENRTIKVYVSGLNNLGAYNVNSGWSYSLNSIENKETSLSPLDVSGTWIDENDSPSGQYPLYQGVDVPAQNTDDLSFNYLIMKYSLELTNQTFSFTTSLNLTIHLESYA